MDSNTAIGAGVGGAAMYMGANRVLASETANDVVSTAGSLYGNTISKLPVVPTFAAAYHARKFARTVVNEHMPTAPPILRDWIIDGLAPRLGKELRDPNKIAAAVGDQARLIADAGVDAIAKRWPGVGADAAKIVDQAAELSTSVATFGAQTANGAIGARVGRGMLRGGAVGAAALGVLAGATVLQPIVRPTTSGIASAVGATPGWLGNVWDSTRDFVLGRNDEPPETPPTDPSTPSDPVDPVDPFNPTGPGGSATNWLTDKLRQRYAAASSHDEDIAISQAALAGLPTDDGPRVGEWDLTHRTVVEDRWGAYDRPWSLRTGILMGSESGYSTREDARIAAGLEAGIRGRHALVVQEGDRFFVTQVAIWGNGAGVDDSTWNAVIDSLDFEQRPPLKADSSVLELVRASGSVVSLH